MEEEMILRTIKTVFEDEQGKYWFNRVAYLDAITKPRPLNASEIKTKLQTSTDLEANDEALIRRINRFSCFVDDCKGGSASTETIKKLGLALRGDEMAFLIPINMKNYFAIGKKMHEEIYKESIQKAYDQLNKLIYLLEMTCFYHYKPNTEEPAGTYYWDKLTEIRLLIDKEFLLDTEIRSKMHQIVDEVEYVVNSCSVPGVPEAWLAINPRIKYFDCVYGVLEETPALYNAIKQGTLQGGNIRFSFYPSENEVFLRKKYFLEKKKEYPTRSEERLYQDELVETLYMRFREEFKNLQKKV